MMSQPFTDIGQTWAAFNQVSEYFSSKLIKSKALKIF